MGGAGAAHAAVWLVDKPAGPTSHAVVAQVRRALGPGVKAGHAGTLDPFATGLLVVPVGRATRLVPYLADLDKTYEATVRLGWTSATGDPEGPVARAGPPPEREEVEAALAGFVGPGVQRVPELAAVKVGGVPLHRRVRRGERIERPERRIVVHGIDLLEHRADGRIRVRVRCGKGTYIRQLAVDIGDRLGCGGYCAALRRTAVGALRVEDASAPGGVRTGEALSPLEALAHLPVRELDDAEAAGVAHGRPVAGDAEGPVALVAGGRLAAVAEPDGAGTLRPRVVLA
jgi:tRNA pseudouridine55 synthase